MKNAVYRRFAKFTLKLLVCVLLTQVTTWGAVRGTVSLTQAESDLRAVVERHQDLQIHAASGRSMDPFFNGYSLLLVRPVGMKALQPGMIVVFRDIDGDLVGHRLHRDAAGILRTQGHANARFDNEVLNDGNLVGVVVGVFSTRERTASSGRFPVVVGKSR